MSIKKEFEREFEKPKLKKARQFPITESYDFLHEYSINLALRLNHYRKVYSLTQMELAEKAGIPQAVLSNFESGWANPSLVNLLKLSKFFKIPIDELIRKA